MEAREGAWEAIEVVQERGDGGLGLCSVLTYKKRNHPGKNMI